MRVLRTSLALTAMLGVAPALAEAQTPAQDMLKAYVPVFKGVEHDLPAALVKGDDPAIKAAAAASKVEQGPQGYTVRDGQGRILRRFLDTNGKKTQRKDEPKAISHLDQWSYYLDGFEVYREIDADDDGYLDEVRWMNSGGTRIAKVQPLEGGGSRIVGWTRISAEEAGKVFVQALVQADRRLLESVLATPEELESIGAPVSTVKRASEAFAARAASFADLSKIVKNTGWTGATAWSGFQGSLPHVIPSDASAGLKSEVVLYENVLIFVDPGSAQKMEKLAYLSAPEIVKIGDAWKFVDMPQAVDPSNPVAGKLASLRMDIFGATGGEGIVPPVEEKLAKMLQDLSTIDVAGPPAPGDNRKTAEWHVTRANLLREIIARVEVPADKLNYQKQVVNNLAEAVKTGVLPAGMDVLDKMVAEQGKIGTFAAYRKILVEFDLAAEEPGADFLKIQKDTLAKFETFLAANPQADEVPEVLFQLATVNEFNGDEAKALTFYGQLAKDFATTEAGKKSSGAIRRIQSDGRPLKVAGNGVHGKAVSSDEFRGKSLLVVFWTSASESDSKELKELIALRAKMGEKGFDVLGVSLDDDAKTLDAFLKANPLPWYTIHEPGGMDSRLANELGIISTPTMILLDAKGQVANRKIKRAAEVEKALEKNLANKGVGLNLDIK